METTKAPFLLSTQNLISFVNTEYLKFIKTNSGLQDRVLTEKFREYYQQTNRQITHVELKTKSNNLIIFETSVYNKSLQKYFDHFIWVFSYDGREWTLQRFRI